LISVDTLRSDHLPAYGYRGVDTPAIDSLARDSILFERAYSHVPLTLPSHVSILSGLLPGEHGVRDNVGYDIDAARTPFLQKTLKELGYATGAAVSAYVLRGATGLSTGFDWYEDTIEISQETSLAGLQRPGTETLARAITWIQSVHDKPFFLFFHLYEPHAPYTPPEPFASRYPLRYDGEIAAADDVVGKLLAELKRLGLYERAIVVFLSDHGEGLGDHDEDEHGVFLYRSTLQVPLIVKLPERAHAGSRVAAPAQLIDVFPTILAALGAHAPAGLQGASLLGPAFPLAPPRPIYSETYYPRLHYGWSDLASLILDRNHYIQAPEPEIFDLAGDPGETHNIAPGQSALADDLRAALSRFPRALQPPAPVDAETLRNLEALGYIGNPAAAPVHGDLPDPKNRRAALRSLRAAFRSYSEKDYPRAIPALRQILSENPLLVDGWDALARSLEASGKIDEALDAYRHALELTGGAPALAAPIASLYLRAGRLDEAEAHAKLALRGDPVIAREVLAQVALRRHRLPEAEAFAREAVDARHGRIAPLIVLAEILSAEGRPADALSLTDRAEAEFAGMTRKDPELIRGLYGLRGKILAGQGEAERAEVAFLKEIAAFPADTAAYTHLAVLYGLIGNVADARETLNKMLVANPSPASYAEAVRTLRVLHDDGAAAHLAAIAVRMFPGDSTMKTLAKR
jgi:arylsulfatase A-like enzyme/cytochrome c-type biogenesis protein CcmH/NrfG